ncbi:MAG: hypothetical protein GW795_00905 [Cyanobacteria bacterium]|nr:hypothetical protein [Cyanobacteria bacterium CG_2015-22_32_23]NCQ04544.1 hypothetical protein [Cyanobacteria bacterium CG_2015-09_32_10]NCQ40467.1 hypothetical protein [Cyanobacteria bacterium CG_2015-04_32_10]NCS84551.1 hypothetical protein [Cyanobacteria bacterium CG_2015-02_32_10]
MGKKSIIFSELKRLDKKQSLLNHDEKRMSKVLENFLQPYIHLTSNCVEKEKLFTLGVIAWNASLYPESERADIINLLFSQEVIGDDSNVQDELTDIITGLIDRKLNFFTDYQRLIVDFKLEEIGQLYHLSVTSQEKTS